MKKMRLREDTCNEEMEEAVVVAALFQPYFPICAERCTPFMLDGCCGDQGRERRHHHRQRLLLIILIKACHKEADVIPYNCNVQIFVTLQRLQSQWNR
ncbi:unnamed protein product [Mesocestoides corti]|uniref:Uncharacterized protein n=1 Tax=Mesocestoides corti TaxID=53468 RepID=A0A0R3UCF8_MESCO|nr:unnamed protein product [Mesocestoides corti]